MTFHVVCRRSEIRQPVTTRFPGIAVGDDQIAAIHPSGLESLWVPERSWTVDGGRPSSKERENRRSTMLASINRRIDGAKLVIDCLLDVEDELDSGVLHSRLREMQETVENIFRTHNPDIVTAARHITSQPPEDAFVARLLFTDAPDVSFLLAVDDLLRQAMNRHELAKTMLPGAAEFDEALRSYGFEPKSVVRFTRGSLGVVAVLAHDEPQPLRGGTAGWFQAKTGVSYVKVNADPDREAKTIRHEKNHSLLTLAKSPSRQYAVKTGSPSNEIQDLLCSLVIYPEDFDGSDESVSQFKSWAFDFSPVCNSRGVVAAKVFNLLHHELVADIDWLQQTIFRGFQRLTVAHVWESFSTSSGEVRRFDKLRKNLPELRARLDDEVVSGWPEEFRHQAHKLLDDVFGQIAVCGEEFERQFLSAIRSLRKAFFIATQLSEDEVKWVRAAAVVLEPSYWHHIPRILERKSNSAAKFANLFAAVRDLLQYPLPIEAIDCFLSFAPVISGEMRNDISRIFKKRETDDGLAEFVESFFRRTRNEGRPHGLGSLSEYRAYSAAVSRLGSFLGVDPDEVFGFEDFILGLMNESDWDVGRLDGELSQKERQILDSCLAQRFQR